MSSLPHAPEGKKLLGESVEESRVKRVEKQQSRYRDRGGIFVPADSNPLLDILLARGVNGESPTKSPGRRRQRGATNVKGKGKPTADQSNPSEEVGAQSKHKGSRKRANSKAAEPDTSKKVAKGRKSKNQASVDDEENDQPVAGPSKPQGTKRTAKQGARAKKTKSIPLETDEDDDRPLGRLKKSKVRDEDETEPDPPAPAKLTATSRKGKQPAKSDTSIRGTNADNSDHPGTGGSKPVTKQTNARGKRKVAPGKGHETPAQDTDIPDHGLATEAAEPSKSNHSKGKRKVVHRESNQAAGNKSKKKPATRKKGDERGEQDVEEEPGPKSKGQKTAVRGKVKPVDSRLDDAAVPGASSSTNDKATKTTAGSAESSSLEAHGMKQSLLKKRPHLYISSDSEGEDDIPLRKAKPSSGIPDRRRGEAEEASPAKRAKLDSVVLTHEEEERARSGTKSRGKGTKTSKVKRKKGAGDSKTEGAEADELRQSPEAVKTAVAQQKAQGVNTSKPEDTRTAAKKRGAAANASEDAEERTNTVVGTKAPKKRHNAGTDPGDEEERDIVAGQPPKHEAKKRRKATGADGQADVAVPHTSNSSLEAQDRDAPPGRDKHKDVRPSSRRKKENRRAPSTKKTTKVPVRRPMPRLSLFPSPSPGKADDSEDEINFLG